MTWPPPGRPAGQVWHDPRAEDRNVYLEAKWGSPTNLAHNKNSKWRRYKAYRRLRQKARDRQGGKPLWDEPQVTRSNGTPSTGRKVAYPLASFAQIEGDKIRSEHIYLDRQTVAEQLGLKPK